MTRQPVLTTLLIAWPMIAPGTLATPRAQAPGKPNILLIVGDDMGYAGQRTDPLHDALYWRFGPQMAIRMGDWKLVKAREARGAAAGGFERRATDEDLAGAQLFNLASDVGERVDLAQKEPGRAKALEAMWKKWNATLEEPRWLPGQRRQ